MGKHRNESELLERRALVMMESKFAKDGRILVHQGANKVFDIYIFSNSTRVGVVEVKADVSEDYVKFVKETRKKSSFKICSQEISGRWAASLSVRSRVNLLDKELLQIVQNLESRRTSSLNARIPNKDKQSLEYKAERLGILSLVREGDAKPGRIYKFLEPTGGLLPEGAPKMSQWINEIFGLHSKKASIDVMSNATQNLGQRVFFIWVSSKTPYEIRHYFFENPTSLPDEQLDIPDWLDSLWIASTETPLESAYALEYSRNFGWTLHEAGSSCFCETEVSSFSNLHQPCCDDYSTTRHYLDGFKVP